MGEESVEEVRATPDSDGPPTLVRDMVNIADSEGLDFEDNDMHLVGTSPCCDVHCFQ